MRVRITQIDGKLPNIALMKLSAWHKVRGDDVTWSRSVRRDMLEPAYDRVYGSAIFDFSADSVGLFQQEFPGAVVGGSWNFDYENQIDLSPKMESIIGEWDRCDYSFFPKFDGSIGFSQRGCRMKCKFCGVPWKEGENRPDTPINRIWRGENFPRHLHLLDNDFTGQTDVAAVAREIIDGKFKVCFNQGINVRLLDEEGCAMLSEMDLRDDQFKSRRLYTAWDNFKDEKVFFRGVDMLERHGIKPSMLMVYMLLGFDKKETWARTMHRFNRMTERGIRPYPMVFGGKPGRLKKLPLGGHNAPIADRTLGEFQRWVLRKAYNFIPFENYDVNARGHLNRDQMELLEAAE